ncbi:hypothetical protein [Chondromyces apiculatus]|uniref:hypothetical protein n=1 Tax=Chondromyces apiculatus TaxID=51 RepID=UPI0005C77A30|nr:hypothetical protein [Chondromyces apiculatus]
MHRGIAVKIVGGRGMGKSVLLQQLEQHLQETQGTRVVRLPGPPEEATVAGAVGDLAARLRIQDLAAPRMDDLLDRVLQGSVARLVALFDETDQYVTLGGGAGGATFARNWFNKLEAIRKQYAPRFSVVFAGGLGLFYLERELGSAIVSRAESFLLEPFGPAEISDLATPFQEDGRPLDENCLEALRVLSGGSPALVTFGLERLWDESAPATQALERIFGVFREQHDSFIRSVHASISQRGRLDAPWRVLEEVRRSAGAVPLQRLREACAAPDESITIDPKQALDLLRAACFVRVDGSTLADPVRAWPVASILNFPETPAAADAPPERLVRDVCAVLANLRRFGRDFHQKDGLLHEEVFSSVLSVGLRLLGWETEREPMQAAGFPDIKVLSSPRTDPPEHTLIEVKLWRGKEYNAGLQQQLDEYRLDDTRHGITVTLGDRGTEGWPEAYEHACLAGRDAARLATPPNLVGRWQVRERASKGSERLTDHLLVQLPKRR